MRTSPHNRILNCAGFTLLELVVVLALVTLVAAAVVFKVQALLSGSRFQAALDGVVATDQQSRDYCTRQRTSGWLIYAPPSRQLYFATTELNSSGDRHFTWGWPQGTVTEVLLPSGNTQPGELARIPVTSTGRTATYAVAISDGYERRSWVLFLGGTGHATVTSDQELVHATLAASVLTP